MTHGVAELEIVLTRQAATTCTDESCAVKDPGRLRQQTDGPLATTTPGSPQDRSLIQKQATAAT